MTFLHIVSLLFLLSIFLYTLGSKLEKRSERVRAKHIYIHHVRGK